MLLTLLLELGRVFIIIYSLNRRHRLVVFKLSARLLPAGI